MSLRSEEDRCSKMREELLTLREDLNKAYLAKDMLEQQKLETDGLISHIEKGKGILHVLTNIYIYIFNKLLYQCYMNNSGDLELELERILLEKSDVQEILIKLEAMCSNHEQDKQKLQEELKKVIQVEYYLSSNVYFNSLIIIIIVVDDRREK